MERQEIIQSSIVRDLAEGVMVIGSDGVIEAINKIMNVKLLCT